MIEQPFFYSNVYDQSRLVVMADDVGWRRSITSTSLQGILPCLYSCTLQYSRREEKMSKKLSLKQGQDLEAVPFFDAHATLNYPLRIRYIVETSEVQHRMNWAHLNETLRILFAFHDLLRTHMFDDQSVKK